jgi:hypothetical protein
MIGPIIRGATVILMDDEPANARSLLVLNKEGVLYLQFQASAMMRANQMTMSELKGYIGGEGAKVNPTFSDAVMKEIERFIAKGN